MADRVLCAEPGVGDEVVWPLLFFRSFGGSAQRVGEPGRVSGLWRAERSANAMVVTDDVVAASWVRNDSPPPAPGVVDLEGVLVYDRHGGVANAADPVRGHVRRVRVTSALLAWRGEGRERSLQWVPGSDWAYDVARSPGWFVGHGPQDGDDGPARRETGIVVDLEVRSPRTGRVARRPGSRS